MHKETIKKQQKNLSDSIIQKTLSKEHYYEESIKFIKLKRKKVMNRNLMST